MKTIWVINKAITVNYKVRNSQRGELNKSHIHFRDEKSGSCPLEAFHRALAKLTWPWKTPWRKSLVQVWDQEITRGSQNIWWCQTEKYTRKVVGTQDSVLQNPSGQIWGNLSIK